jgi:hypothetical protein
MRAQTLGVDQQIHEVVVPIEEITELKDGKRKRVKRSCCRATSWSVSSWTTPSWSVIRDTPGVTSFVGNEGKPTPVKIREVAKFLLPPETATVPEDAEGADSASGVDVSATGVAMAPTPTRPTRSRSTTRSASPSPSSPVRSPRSPRPSQRSTPRTASSRPWSPSSAARPRSSWSLTRSRSSTKLSPVARRIRPPGFSVGQQYIHSTRWPVTSPASGQAVPLSPRGSRGCLIPREEVQHGEEEEGHRPHQAPDPGWRR